MVTPYLYQNPARGGLYYSFISPFYSSLERHNCQMLSSKPSAVLSQCREFAYQYWWRDLPFALGLESQG
jgi:hypothetical protein